MSSSTIKYRINSVSSQSPNYPAGNLINEGTSLGWQSQYSPSYPQQVNLQFFTPIRSKTLKLTFHQYKIPSCVQIFVRLTAKQNYRKLGYIIPNDNSQSSFEHKEIKTLYFQFPCNFIKLVFYQNFKNQMNLFEQVGLEDLQVQGQAMTYNEIRNLDLTQEETASDQEQEQLVRQEIVEKHNRQQKKRAVFPPSGLEQTSTGQDINNRFNEVYAHLQGQKAEAVQNQDFQLAAHLKNAIQSFKDIQSDIKTLEFQKRQALEQQDFDKCHRIKQQIVKKREQFQYRVQQLISNQENFMAEHSHSRILNDNQVNQTTEKKNNDIRDYFNSTPERQSQNNVKNIPVKTVTAQPKKESIDHNEQVLPAVLNRLMGKPKPNQLDQYGSANERSILEQPAKNQNNYLHKNHHSKSPRNKALTKSPPKSPNKNYNNVQNTTNQNTNNVKSPILRYHQNENEQWTENNLKRNQIRIQDDNSGQIPSRKQDKHEINSELNQLSDKFKQYDLQPFDLKLRMKLESHFNVINQPYWQMIMNKNWKTKKQALKYVKTEVYITNKQNYMAALQFISFSINDVHTQILVETLSLLRKIIQEGSDNQVIFSLPHLPYFVETIMTSLLSSINSTNKQLSQESYNLYLLLGMVNFLSIQQIIQKLIKHKQTTKVTPQYLILKIGLMISIIEKYNESTKHYKDIVQWAMYFLQDPNHKVRSEASYLMLILTDIVGEDKIIGLMKDKPKILESFYAILNSSNLIEQSKIDQSSRVIDQNSRITDKNRSRIQQNQSKVQQNASFIANKSLSKQKLKQIGKNPTKISSNKSIISNKSGTQGQKLKNPWQSQSNLRKQGKLGYQNAHQIQQHSYQQDEQLQYSKQSQFYGSSIKKDTPSNVFHNRGYQNSQFSHIEKQYNDQKNQNIIKVLEQQDGEIQYEGDLRSEPQLEDQGNDSSTCDYCFMELNGLDQRTHLMTECKVIAYCEECGGRIYIREIIEHLLVQCTMSNHHQKCKKCGLVFNINEINQHVGQGMCRLQRGQDWERCQFCGQDVMANDNKWIEHSYKCPNLPERPITQTENVTEKYSEAGDQ